MEYITEKEIAQYVDAVEDETQSELPEATLVHVEDCLECKIEILEVWELVDSFKTFC